MVQGFLLLYITANLTIVFNQPYASKDRCEAVAKIMENQGIFICVPAGDYIRGKKDG